MDDSRQEEAPSACVREERSKQRKVVWQVASGLVPAAEVISFGPKKPNNSKLRLAPGCQANHRAR